MKVTSNQEILLNALQQQQQQNNIIIQICFSASKKNIYIIFSSRLLNRFGNLKTTEYLLAIK